MAECVGKLYYTMLDVYYIKGSVQVDKKCALNLLM